jgi:hypothetical protein
MLRAAGFRKLNVLRPASVIGDSVTGYSSTYHGIYLFAQFTWMSQQRAGAARGETWKHPVRLFQTGTEKHHLIPVDVVSKAILTIIGQRDQRGGSYHLTPTQPCTVIELESALSRYFKYQGVRFVDPDARQTAVLNETEKAFYDALSRGKHRYLIGDPSFDCANTLRAVPDWAKVRVCQELLMRIFDFAVQQRFGRTRIARWSPLGGDGNLLPSMR